MDVGFLHEFHDSIPSTYSSCPYKEFEKGQILAQIYLATFMVEKGFEPSYPIYLCCSPPYPSYLCCTENTRALFGINKYGLRSLNIKKVEKRPLIQLQETKWLFQNSSKYHRWFPLNLNSETLWCYLQ